MRVVAVMTAIAVTNTAAITPIVEPALKQLYSGVIHIARSGLSNGVAGSSRT